MKARCKNANHADYRNYGGRGISVCNRWMDFVLFKADMGDTFDERLDIDRIDVNRNYEPGNCRWVTNHANQRNKRTNHIVTINGQTKILAEWEEATGIKANTILTRIRRGWAEHRLLEIANR